MLILRLLLKAACRQWHIVGEEAQAHGHVQTRHIAMELRHLVTFALQGQGWDFASLVLSACSTSTWTAPGPQSSAPFERDSQPWTLGDVLVWRTVLWSLKNTMH